MALRVAAVEGGGRVTAWPPAAACWSSGAGNWRARISTGSQTSCCAAAGPCITELRWVEPCEGRSPNTFSASQRSEEHTSELQSLMRISYAVFCLKKKTTKTHQNTYKHEQK